MPDPAPQASRARVFISYKRDVQPDELLALDVFQALSTHHDVFLDRTIRVGSRWGEQIDAALRQAEYLIVLLSAEATRSEMVLAEVETVHRRSKAQPAGPTILPVRVAYTEALPYALRAYLNPVQTAFWSTPDDTPPLIDALRQAIAGTPLGPSLPPPTASPVASESALEPPLPAAALEIPGGTLRPESRFYIERQADRVAEATLAEAGVTITIKGPRQMGKSSLLVRLVHTARERGKRVAVLDLQLCDRSTLHNDEAFFRYLCAWLSEELEIEDTVETFWAAPLGNPQRCTRYVARHLLPQLGAPLLLAMDEVDVLFDTPFRSDFFSMLRAWHNNRALQPIWQQLDLVLVTSTEPYQFVANHNQSPFNVGETLDLSDFTPAQVADLNRRHQLPLDDAALQRLLGLIGGHPFLVRRALYRVASGHLTVPELFDQALEDHGPFGDHLRRHLMRLHDDPELLASLRQVLTQQTCADERAYFRLHGAGLVRREGRTVVPRLPLYTAYFGERLRG